VEIVLRPTVEDDWPVLYEQQLDPVATEMAVFASRDWDAFTEHQRKIAADPEVIARTIVADGVVAGSIGSFTIEGERQVGYWVGREHWGRGIATAALVALLEVETTRPLRGHVVTTNGGSKRVLEKAGFVLVDTVRGADGVDEHVLELA
jgi:RimJ/RimL family protein N-acetyltransferase